MLFSTTAEFKNHVPTTLSNTDSNWKPEVRRIENSIIKKILGSDLYQGLDEAYQSSIDPNTPVELSIHFKWLIEKVRDVIAPFAYAGLAAVVNVRMTDGGLRTATSQDTEQARQWMVNDMKRQLLKNGYDAIEQLYLFLEENAEGYFPEWLDTPEHAELNQFFINSAVEFNKHVDIGESRWTFNSLRANMGIAETLYLLPALGQEYYDELKEKIITNTTTIEDEDILKTIRKATALLTVGLSTTGMNLIINDGHLTVLTDGTADIKTETKLSMEQMKDFLREKMEQGNIFLIRMKELLNKNADDYPTYKASSAYTAPSGFPPDHGNANRKRLFTF